MGISKRAAVKIIADIDGQMSHDKMIQRGLIKIKGNVIAVTDYGLKRLIGGAKQ